LHEENDIFRGRSERPRPFVAAPPGFPEAHRILIIADGNFLGGKNFLRDQRRRQEVLNSKALRHSARGLARVLLCFQTSNENVHDAWVGDWVFDRQRVRSGCPQSVARSAMARLCRGLARCRAHAMVEPPLDSWPARGTRRRASRSFRRARQQIKGESINAVS